MDDLEQLLADNDPSLWELALQDFVRKGKIAIDEFLWKWLWNRVTWPDPEYSIFYNKRQLVNTKFFGTSIEIFTGEKDKRRFAEIRMFESNPYHPDFEEVVFVSENAWRFYSVGNPFIDEPNYEWWEKMLFCKLLNQAFEDRKGLDFLIERSRR